MGSLIIFFVAVFCVNIKLVRSFQLFTNNVFPSDNLTPGCIAALLTDVDCFSSLKAFRPNVYLPADTLEEVCTDTCSQALDSYYTAVSSACDGETYEGVFQPEPIEAIPVQIKYHFDRYCMTDNGQWCNVVAYQAATGDVVDYCDDCLLKGLQFQAGSSLFDGAQLQEVFSSVTSSCSKTGFPLTTTTLPYDPITPTGTDPAPAPACGGTTYDLQAGDTCQSVSQSENIGTAWLLSDNNLFAYCFDFPSTGSLCLQHTCATYTVQEDDTCKTIAGETGVHFQRLVAWNPILGQSCERIANSVGDQICISPPGNGPNPTTTTTVPSSAPTAAPVPADIANMTNTNCALYHEVQMGEYCNLVVIKYSISLDDFMFLNPSINENCTNLFALESYCVKPVGAIDNYPGHPGYMSPTTSAPDYPYSNLPKATYTPPPVVFDRLNPIAGLSRTDCRIYVDADVIAIDISETLYESVCDAILVGWGLTMAQLSNWNPSLTIENNCAVELGFRYCMAPYSGVFSAPPQEPTFTATETDITTTTASETTTATPGLPIRDGATANCTEYIEATGDITTCAELLTAAGITMAEFYEWNPAVSEQCTTFWLEYSYCISITTSPTTTTTTTTTTTDPSSTPTGPPISTDGTCSTSGFTCLGSTFGDCCSQYNSCGSTSEYCGDFCQASFGTCDTPPPPPISIDGSCGGVNSTTCIGSEFGDCCSQYGFCGSDTAFCSEGCQSLFGICDGDEVPETPVSIDGGCGATANGTTCLTSTFGDCCSQYGFCGSDTAFCTEGCQAGFGACDGVVETPVSIDGSCGATGNGTTCLTSTFGDCCSQHGYCGSDTAFCADGCQAGFGTCDGVVETPVSTDGSCGGDAGTTCVGSEFGDCCSQYGFCGSEAGFCGDGCLVAFGVCGVVELPVSTDGICAGAEDVTCLGSSFGDCCSEYGFCGTGSGYCGTGCHVEFGTCD